MAVYSTVQAVVVELPVSQPHLSPPSSIQYCLEAYDMKLFRLATEGFCENFLESHLPSRVLSHFNTSGINHPQPSICFFSSAHELLWTDWPQGWRFGHGNHARFFAPGWIGFISWRLAEVRGRGRQKLPMRMV